MSLGQQLRQARETQNLTVDAIAKKLFINKQIIIDIEEDNYTHMVAPVYARGYLLAYARLLQVAAEPLLEEFTRITEELTANQPPMQVLQNIPTTIHHPHTSQQRHWLGYTTILVMIIAVALWVSNHHSHTPVPPPLETPSAATTTAPTATTPSINVEPELETTIISIPQKN